MAKNPTTKSTKSTKTVETLKHDEATRKNIPTAEFQSVLDDAQKNPRQVRYPRPDASELAEEKSARNRDLDPQLVWRGKDEQDWSDLVVHAPPLYIQEKVHPKALIDDLLRQTKESQFDAGQTTADLFADFNGIPKGVDKTEFYQHDQNWSNRMILGDSLQVMAMFVDELQYVAEDELAALFKASYRTAQRSLPVVLVGAGLPQLPGKMGRAKSYAERLFDFPQIGPLPNDAARLAIAKPAADQGVAVNGDALDRIIRETRGYPYFLQEWGKHAWDVADASPITLDDVEQATASTIAALDESFFRVRFDRLTPLEKKYLCAMVALGSGPHRSGDIAEQLSREVTTLRPIRSQLILKGMIWSPSHGDTAFTVPLFDEFMKQIMPGDDWKH